MRTTVTIDDHLLASAKHRARERDVTLGRLVEDALRRELARTATPGTGPDVPIFARGTGLRPGIDVSSTRALLEALDDGVPVDELR